MIFVTVGAQMPFDRLVRAVDQWAHKRGRDDVFAQIGMTNYLPENIQWTSFLSTEEFKQRYEAANVIVAHAGTGSIITALQLGKPILIMPRHAGLRETRNDHQIATAEQFRRFDSVVVALDEEELITQLDGIDKLRGRQCIEPYASRELVAAITEFIDDVDMGSPNSN
jgi:UDP-N-acetylglucosamine transferase subunit ALG13